MATIEQRLHVVGARTALNDLEKIVKTPGNWKTKDEFQCAVLSHIFVILEDLVQEAEERCR